jgi:hypothetical protein
MIANWRISQPSIAELGRVEYGLSRTVALVSFASMSVFLSGREYVLFTARLNDAGINSVKRLVK